MLPLALGVLLVVTACGQLTPPEAYSPPASSTVVDGEDVEIDSQVAARSGVDAALDEFVPTAAPGYVPTLLVSGTPAPALPDGTDTTDGAGAAGEAETPEDAAAETPEDAANPGDADDPADTGDPAADAEPGEAEAESAPVDSASVPAPATVSAPVTDIEATRAVDDLSGGLVLQESGGPVAYQPAQGQRELLDEDARLLDVGYWGGSPRAFVDVGGGQIDWIRLASIEQEAERERQPHILLEEGEEVVALAASRNLQAVIVQNDQCGELRFYGSDGQRLQLLGPDAPECTFPGRPAFGSVALSPDGDAVAYTIVTYRGDGTEAATELVVRELIGDSVGFITTRRIGEGLDAITSLAYDGDRVAYVKESAEGQQVMLLDIADRLDMAVDGLDETEVHSVSFARLPIASTLG